MYLSTEKIEIIGFSKIRAPKNIRAGTKDTPGPPCQRSCKIVSKANINITLSNMSAAD